MDFILTTLPETLPTTIIAIVRANPKAMLTDIKLVFPLKTNCATEAKPNDRNKNVPNNSAKHSLNRGFLALNL